MKNDKGFLLISMLIAVAIISIVVFTKYNNGGSSPRRNIIEQGQSAIQKAEDAKVMMEARGNLEVEY